MEYSAGRATRRWAQPQSSDSAVRAMVKRLMREAGSAKSEWIVSSPVQLPGTMVTALPVGAEKATRDFMRITAPPPTTSTSRTRSAGADAQSARADNQGKDEINLPATVRPSGPSSQKTPFSQSARADTYSIPGRGRFDRLASIKHQASENHFGALVRAGREEMNLSQSALADAIGIARGSIANIESGRYPAGPELRQRLINALGLTPTDEAAIPRTATDAFFHQS